MIAFQVDDMTCGHCAHAIEQAIRALDPGARVSVDLSTKRVSVSGTAASAAAIAAALTDAGYAPRLLDAAVIGEPEQAARSCCGGGRCRGMERVRAGASGIHMQCPWGYMWGSTWRARQESNLRPLASEANTLSPELRARSRPL